MAVGAVRVEKEKSVFVCDIEGGVRPAIGLVYEQRLGAKLCQNLISVVVIASSETRSRGRVASHLSRVKA